MAPTYWELVADLTGPGAPFEIETAPVRRRRALPCDQPAPG